MQQVQFIQITPEQLQESIVNGIKRELEALKKEFQPKEPTTYLTRKEVAEMLQVDLSTIHNWCKSGKLKPHGIGSRVYFKRDQLEDSIIEINK